MLRQVLWSVGQKIEIGLLGAGHRYTPSLEAVPFGNGDSDNADVGFYFPNNWRQTERELCRYAVASKVAMQDLPRPLSPPRPARHAMGGGRAGGDWEGRGAGGRGAGEGERGGVRR